jgi:hypothetical protein
VFVFASSHGLDNPLAVAAVGESDDANAYAQHHLTATILVFKNTLDWVTGGDALAKCSSAIVPTP